MVKSRIVDLQSGAKLEIRLAPFADGKALYQAVLEEMKGLKIDVGTELDVNFFKDVFCSGFSSKKIEKALAECMKRVTYNDAVIDEKIFEPLEAREDYVQVIFEVLVENIQPFTKTLMQQLQRMQGLLLAPKSPA